MTRSISLQAVILLGTRVMVLTMGSMKFVEYELPGLSPESDN